MNKHIFYLFFWVLFAGIAITSNAQNFTDLDKSPMDAVMARNHDNSPLIRIIYSRPFKRNREIFGKLVPFGEIWRTGANESTEIRFYENCLINGKSVSKGTYALFSIPNEDEWTLIINKNNKSWGTYNYNENEDVLRFTVPAQKTATEVEQFSISTRPAKNGVYVLMGWDDTFLRFEIKLDPDFESPIKDVIDEEILEAEKKPKKRKRFLGIF